MTIAKQMSVAAAVGLAIGAMIAIWLVYELKAGCEREHGTTCEIRYEPTNAAP